MNMQSTSANDSEIVVSIKDLTRTFKRKTVLEDVYLEIPRGVVFGLVGENGAGKTTLIRHLLGRLRPDKGAVQVFGLDPAKNPVGVLSRLGYLSEDRNLPSWMKVWELIRYTRAFYPGWDPEYAEELREQFALDPHEKIKNLSRGELARMGLLVALAYRPELLLLDEPSSGLDPVARRDILEAIVRAVADEGRTVVFSSHLLDEVDRVADQIGMIHHGKMMFQGNLEEIKAQHHCCILYNPDSMKKPDLPGQCHAAQEGNEWAVVCEAPLEIVHEAITASGWQLLETRQPSLDEVFVARIKGKRS